MHVTNARKRWWFIIQTEQLADDIQEHLMSKSPTWESNLEPEATASEQEDSRKTSDYRAFKYFANIKYVWI